MFLAPKNQFFKPGPAGPGPKNFLSARPTAGPGPSLDMYAKNEYRVAPDVARSRRHRFSNRDTFI
ncbi:hypothetical protein CAEBREN_02334 [Caenorhabditis brenneri]|uniref:Uncharacterized protein n=1 Tax=Caenorhabditis brenneri TaxID=135651 RepID=G0PB40_CAEBE|nr:hypothetical protein CAEBREN_02334 [Caenorhabditis brenneri]